MQIKLVVEGKDFPIGCESVEAIVLKLPDVAAYRELSDLLATSDSSAVRAAVASRQNISDETVSLLARDNEIEVIENLIGQNGGRIVWEDIQRIVQRNLTRINRQIAGRVESFDESDVTALAKVLSQSGDPTVRAALAQNSSAPGAFIKSLANDPDPEVRQHAIERLKQRRW